VYQQKRWWEPSKNIKTNWILFPPLLIAVASKLPICPLLDIGNDGFLSAHGKKKGGYCLSSSVAWCSHGDHVAHVEWYNGCLGCITYAVDSSRPRAGARCQLTVKPRTWANGLWILQILSTDSCELLCLSSVHQANLWKVMWKGFLCQITSWPWSHLNVTKCLLFPGLHLDLRILVTYWSSNLTIRTQNDKVCSPSVVHSTVYSAVEPICHWFSGVSNFSIAFPNMLEWNHLTNAVTLENSIWWRLAW